MISPQVERNETFIELFSANHNRIRSFILTLVPNTSDADDIMQDTSRLMWENFERFEIGTNFLSWAFTIAKYQILSYRNKHHLKVPLSLELVDLLAEESVQPLAKESERLDALRGCLKKLNKKDFNLLESRFFRRKTARELSKQMGVAMNTVYRNESRILSLLMKCIHKTLEVREL